MNRGRALAQLSAILAGRTARESDWTEILTLACEELVAPELCARLQHDLLPEHVLAFLADVRARNRERNRRLLSMLSEAVAALNAADVEPVLLKGAALHAQVGDCAADRMMADIDLLVLPAEFDRGLTALANAGFSIVEDKRSLARHPAAALARTHDVGGLDLHQRAPGGQIVPDLFARCDRRSFAGGRVRVPPPELQVLIGVWHDQWHEGMFWRGGFHLRHLMDVALLAASAEGVDWRQVLEMSGGGVRRLAVRTQMLAARRLAGALVPDEVTAGLWPAIGYRRQRLQYVWPALNAPFRGMGLTRAVWRPLSQWMAQRAHA